jgi:hypothetical protein
MIPGNDSPKLKSTVNPTNLNPRVAYFLSGRTKSRVYLYGQVQEKVFLSSWTPGVNKLISDLGTYTSYVVRQMQEAAAARAEAERWKPKPPVDKADRFTKGNGDKGSRWGSMFGNVFFALGMGELAKNNVQAEAAEKYVKPLGNNMDGLYMKIAPSNTQKTESESSGITNDNPCGNGPCISGGWDEDSDSQDKKKKGNLTIKIPEFLWYADGTCGVKDKSFWILTINDSDIEDALSQKTPHGNLSGSIHGGITIADSPEGFKSVINSQPSPIFLEDFKEILQSDSNHRYFRGKARCGNGGKSDMAIWTEL